MRIAMKTCNRKACRKDGADWWNHSTQAWYCRKCALKINAVNPEVPGLCEHRPDGTEPEPIEFPRLGS